VAGEVREGGHGAARVGERSSAGQSKTSGGSAQRGQSSPPWATRLLLP
jgi:hypothetical protein